MQLTLKDLLKEEHILIGLRARDARHIIAALNQALVASGHTQPAFADHVWEREQTFPTGLPTRPVPVAIPHADPQYVNASALCFGVLEKPVTFAQMGTDGSTILPTPIVILLAIKEREKQVEMIQQLIGLIQSPQLLDALLQAENARQAFQIISHELEAP